MSTKAESADVRFEIVDGLLRISVVENSSIISRLVERTIAELPLSTLRAQEDEQVQRAIGAVVISAVEEATNGSLDILSAAGRVRAMQSVAAVLKKQSDRGDPDAQYSLATVYMNLSVAQSDASMLEVAEKLLLASASQGHGGANRFLEESWGSIKKEYRKMIGG